MSLKLERAIETALPAAAERYLGPRPYTLEPLDETTACLSSAARRLFLKVIGPDDPRGQNEIHANRRLGARPGFPAPGLLFTLELGSSLLAGWEWSAGADLRRAGREALPRAFAELGRFHAAHRVQGPVSSPTSFRPYPTVQAMLEAELDMLAMGLSDELRVRCADAFSELRAGFVTTIHGDMHPGNIRVSGNAIQFVDWGYATESLNLFDLGYVQRHASAAGEGAARQAWWHIGPSEADAVLEAYFSACGMGGADWRRLHTAVEAWSALYSRRNALAQQDRSGARKSLEALRVVLEAM